VPDLILTGVPRSGTTLAGAIIDQAPDSLCLSEPDRHVDLMREATSAEDFVVRLSREFDAIRRIILAGGSVSDRRRADGAPLTNYFTDSLPDRRREAAFTIRNITRLGLSADFVLGVKHNALYSAVLPEIVASDRFRVVVIIRDPVALVTSWRSLDLPISRGRLPAGERFWPKLGSLCRAELELTEKQLRICDLLFGRFLRWAGRVTILRYEALVTDPVRLLRAAGVPEVGSPSATDLIKPMPRVPVGDDGRISLAERIRQLVAAGELRAIARFYPDYWPRRQMRTEHSL
jgi:hypothetical protein